MPNSIGDHIYIGIKGHVIALDRATGEILWSSALKGSDFVNVVLDGDRVLAATRGEMFCLDPATGHITWQNSLKGFGMGFVTIATVNAPGQSIAPQQQKKKHDDDVAATSAAG